MELSDCSYVILRKNRERCTLNKKVLNLLNEESVSGESMLSPETLSSLSKLRTFLFNGGRASL